MELTQNQKDCIEKARKFRRRDFRNKKFFKLYLKFCESEVIDTNTFVSLVNNRKENLCSGRTQPFITIEEYHRLFVDNIIGENSGKTTK